MNVVCLQVAIFCVVVSGILGRAVLNNTDPTRGRFSKVTLPRKLLDIKVTPRKFVNNIVYKCFNRGVKYDFPFINVHNVSGEVLKSEGEARGFEHFPSRTLRMLINDKIMSDRYYCINKKMSLQKRRKYANFYFIFCGAWK